MTALCRDLWRLVRSWWNHDRIRCRPDEGGLLGLQPGDLLAVGETTFEVVARSVEEHLAGRVLRLTCRGESAVVEIEMTATARDALPRIEWIEAGTRRAISPEAIEVWPRGDRPRFVRQRIRPV